MSAFRGFGKIKIAPYASGASFGARAFADVSNASAFAFSFSQQEENLPDYRDGSGGTDASFSRIDVVSGNIDLRHFTAENLALGVWGTTSMLAATAITGEAHKAHAGKFVPADRLIDLTVPPVIKKGATTLNTADYTVSTGGLTFADTFATSGLIDGDDITFDYTPQASVDVQALIGSAPVVSIFFEGVNAVDEKDASARMWKCKLGVASNIGLITDTFGTLPITFTVLKDETVVGSGTSKFFALQQAS